MHGAAIDPAPVGLLDFGQVEAAPGLLAEAGPDMAIFDHAGERAALGDHRVEHRNVHILTLAGCIAMAQCREYSNCCE